LPAAPGPTPLGSSALGDITGFMKVGYSTHRDN